MTTSLISINNNNFKNLNQGKFNQIISFSDTGTNISKDSVLNIK